MERRGFLKAGAAALVMPSVSRAASRSVLRMVPQSDLGSIDPHWSSDGVARNHGFLIYDTLYGLSLDLSPSPQMAAGAVEEDDGRVVTITLREGLLFHDGEPVRATDCVASILRWSKRNPFGQKLASVIDELSAVDDHRLRFRLRRRFPMLINALAVTTQPPVIMPERVAQTDPFKQITETIGSGPFRFRRDEFLSGSRVVYDRNPAYRPRETGAASLTAGPKQVLFERLEWLIIPDGATAAAALRNGEIDWIEQSNPDQQEALRADNAISVEPLGPFPSVCIMRLNFLQPPFNDKAVRRAILAVIAQDDFMVPIAGDDPSAWWRCGAFLPASQMATQAGLEVLDGPRSSVRAREILAAAGYTGQVARVIAPTDKFVPAQLGLVSADALRRTGLNVDFAVSDWGTLLQRRSGREPVEKGGWSAFSTNLPGLDCADPAGHIALRGNGTGPGSFAGWPTLPRLEELRDAWFDAPNIAAQKAICIEIQHVVMDEVAFVPLGANAVVTAIRRDLADRKIGMALFWGMHRV